MNARQEKALARVRAAQARAAQRHSYEYDETRRLLIVREPDMADGAPVCVMLGDPNHPATNAQAAAVCRALDALMKKEAAHDLDQ